MTEEEARIRNSTEKWIDNFYDIPLDIIRKLFESGDEILEITPLSEIEHDSFLPMWGTMWSFRHSIDEDWLADKENLQAMADCGFRIYEQENYGYIFGIDSMGYDFYEAHWIPLYKARGLKWHCN